MARTRKLLLFLLLCISPLTLMGKDILIFGNRNSEQKHSLSDSLSEVYIGGMGETARRMLPEEPKNWKGGVIRFKMKVDSGQQNYFTVRCWGSESDETVVMLFIEGKQIGYRHLGDYDLLHRGNGSKPNLGRFYYYTLPLPLKYTQGKFEVNLELRSYGRIWDYGNTFEQYQRNMEGKTIGFYKAYVHTTPCFIPDKKEKQGKDVVSVAPFRQVPGIEVFQDLKNKISACIGQIMEKKSPLGQQEIWLLADAYSVSWTPAYRNADVIQKIKQGIDDHYKKYLEDPTIIYTDGSVYNGDWMTTCLLARSIRHLWNELKDSLSALIMGTTRNDAWSQLMIASLKYGTSHRRQYTNQSMIIDMAIYECNRALMLMNPKQALPEYETLRYLYESLSLAPWLGKVVSPNKYERPLGDNYWQLTSKGLTKELGFVGYYGEVLDWINHIYKATCIPGNLDSGDQKIKDQLLRIAEARYNFRYPAVDNEGFRCFRAEAVVGWRDGNHYPADIIYGDRGTAWDATPLLSASTTLDKNAIGIAQQMLRDNQFFSLVAQKLSDVGNIRNLQSCLHIPDEYELIMQQPESTNELPMSSKACDYVFADEEDGVVAIKNGDEILYASLYWRARYGINKLAKVHYITPYIDRIANVCTEVKFTDSGLRYTRPDWVNLCYASWREWYEGVHSAHAGETLPIAQVPEGIKFKPGDENAYAGRADFYLLEYGNYVIGMNGSTDKVAELPVPSGRKIINLTNNKEMVTKGNVTVSPQSTVVLYIKEK